MYWFQSFAFECNLYRYNTAGEEDGKNVMSVMDTCKQHSTKVGLCIVQVESG
jgi:hypothetical protein